MKIQQNFSVAGILPESNGLKFCDTYLGRNLAGIPAEQNFNPIALKMAKGFLALLFIGVGSYRKELAPQRANSRRGPHF